MAVLQNAGIMTGERLFWLAAVALIAGWLLYRRGNQWNFWVFCAGGALFLSGMFFIMRGRLIGLPGRTGKLAGEFLILIGGSIVWSLLMIRLSRVHHEEARAEQSCAVLSAVVQGMAVSALKAAGRISAAGAAGLALLICAVLAVQIAGSTVCRSAAGRAPGLAAVAVVISVLTPTVMLLILGG